MIELSVNKSELLKGLKPLNTIASSKMAKTLPVLENFLLETEKDKLIITASNTKCKGIFTVDFGINIKTSGKTLVNAQKLTSLIETFDNAIKIKADETRMRLKENKAEISIPVCASEYPENFSKLKSSYNTEFTISGNLLKEALIKTNDFKDINNFSIIGGINFKASNNILNICALDGKTMAIYKIKIENDINTDFTIPPDCAHLLLKSLTTDDVNIKVSEKNICMKFGNIILESALLTGNFPDYEGIMRLHKKPTNFLTFERIALENMLKKVSCLRETPSNISAKPTAKTVPPYYICIECGEPAKITFQNKFTDLLPAEYKGDKLKVSLNPDYLLRVLKAIDTEKITLEASESINPVYVHSDVLTTIIMPVYMR